MSISIAISMTTIEHLTTISRTITITSVAPLSPSRFFSIVISLSLSRVQMLHHHEVRPSVPVTKTGFKVYVYDLPAAFNYRISSENTYCRDEPFGTEIYIHEALLQSPYYTSDPNEANLFYVPVCLFPRSHKSLPSPSPSPSLSQSPSSLYRHHHSRNHRCLSECNRFMPHVWYIGILVCSLNTVLW